MIHELFRVLNFGILVGIGVYVFRKRVLPMLEHQLLMRHATRDNFHKQQETLKATHERIVLEIKEQEALLYDLIAKVTQWRTVFEREQQAETEAFKLIMAKIKERRTKQEHGWYVMNAQRFIVPKAIADAERELIERMTSKKEQENYIARVMQSLHKDVV